MNKINKKIAIYIRVSSDKQLKQGFSFEDQEEKLIEEVKREKQEYIVYRDGGISGTKIDNRQGLIRLMKDVELGLISKVYVTKLSRLARNARDLLNIVYDLKRQDVSFRAINDNIDTSTPMGKAMITLMGLFAEMERDIIIEQTRAGAERRAKEGKMYGSGPIFGYDRVLDETSEKKTMKIVINEQEGEVVRTIFEMYLGGYGYKAITNKLNKAGVRTKKNKLFAINTIKTILDNPLYAGYIRYGKYKDWNIKRRKGLSTEHIIVEGNHDAIVTKEDWDQVQEKMKQNQRRKAPVGKYILAGVLACPECGSKMTGSKTKYKTKNGPVERLYYSCSQFHNKGLTACHANGIRVDLIDPIAIKKIAKKLNSPELVETLYNYITENTIDENSADGKRRILEIEIEKRSRLKSEVLSMHREGLITASELKEELEKIKDRTEEYQHLMSELIEGTDDIKSQSLLITKQDVESFLSDISSILKTKVESERLKVKELIRLIVSRIDITNKSTAQMDIQLSYDEMLYGILNRPTQTK
ncbi:recombinase family protein [Candidatus Xianfuyuplasma coldseepsis]|uniref:Recombinase family protein n=1 Tax=Candidatus Xianfuyuplasma coldseepsis TaxID=2782163 RepID=A0A7L7KR18_9MOLU|nr:recombinase family protein [Xianfuyuplasma coldseepsis]QMS85270.1 recombinase family protein [Xianfuyuplasma coldseepsis]